MNRKTVLFCIKSQISVTLAGLARSPKTLKMIAPILLFRTSVNSFVLKRTLSTIQSLAFGPLLRLQATVLVPTIFSQIQTPIFAHTVKVTILKRLPIVRGIQMPSLFLNISIKLHDHLLASTALNHMSFPTAKASHLSH